MRHEPLLFLGLLFALALSWLGMVATPQFQIGGQQPTNIPPANVLYPTALPGLAQLGREVYRANGCAYCHTQVIRQEGTRLELVVTNPGTNEATVVQALLQIRNDLTPEKAREILTSTPKVVLTELDKGDADRAQQALSDAGAEASVRVIPLGPDISRGWGTRVTVAHDYLFETPLMLGVTRLGPDLTNIGLRQPDVAWHLVHLYDPKLKVPGSTMPRYPFLFETRPRGGKVIPGAIPIDDTKEIVPTREAQALAAYLVSLSAEIALFEAPAPRQAAALSATGATNQSAASGAITNQGVTNQAAGPAPTNDSAAGQAAP